METCGIDSKESIRNLWAFQTLNVYFHPPILWGIKIRTSIKFGRSVVGYFILFYDVVRWDFTLKKMINIWQVINY